MVGRWAAPLAALFLICTSAAAAPATHGPVPRFMSLKNHSAAGRRGPGTDQPVLWIYQREGLPLLVTGESGPWLRVRDPDGAQTWMLAGNLEERRTVMVRGTREALLRRNPESGSSVMAYLAPGVVGGLTACNGDWRRVAIGGRVGWVSRDALWGDDANCPSQRS